MNDLLSTPAIAEVPTDPEPAPAPEATPAAEVEPVDDGLTATVREMRGELSAHFKGADPGSVTKAMKAMQPISAKPKSWGSRDLAGQAVKAYRGDIGVPAKPAAAKKPAVRTAPAKPRRTPVQPVAVPEARPVAPPPTRGADRTSAQPASLEPAPPPVQPASRVGGGSRVEGVVQVAILLVVGLAAGAASFTHVHDWTMANSPAGTPDWFGWANACISELVPVTSLLEIRRRRRQSGARVGYPLFLLIASAVLSLSAQLAVAKPGASGWLLSAVPALAFIALVKLVLAPTTEK